MIQSPAPKLQFFDNNGAPLAGGKLYTYEAGTTTPTPTYGNKAGTTVNTNPIILDARGEAEVWLDTLVLVKYVLKDATDVEIYTVDNMGSTTVTGVITGDLLVTGTLSVNGDIKAYVP
jgi:hypothetical protein